MTTLLLYLFLAIGFSFLCSIMEAVLLTTPLSFISAKIEEGKKSAKLFKKLKESVDRPLSAILSINTIAHTVGAAGVGAQAVKVFGEIYFGVISAILTILILIFSEILPKTIGAYYWKWLALGSAKIISVMVYLTYPIVKLSEGMTYLIAKKGKEGASVSREEFSAMVNIGEQEGIIGIAESRIIKNIIKLRSIKVADVMTPRVVVETADSQMSVREFYMNKNYLHFSRIPIYKDNKENITGFVYRNDVVDLVANDKFNVKICEIEREILVVPELQPLTILWEKLLAVKAHIALVVDEYGGFEGIVTLEDVIETIIGLEIMDERDVEPDMQQYAKKRWHERKKRYS